jgi:transcriptional regulator with XRE-family HTH domain
VNDSCARFGAALREARLRRKLTQERLAERSGLTYKAIGEIERGDGNPRLTTMDRLAEALDVDLRELMPLPTTERLNPPDYRIVEALQSVREAVISIESVVGAAVNPVYRRKRRGNR